MKKIIATIFLVLFISTGVFSISNLPKKPLVDSPFAVYGNDISWSSQKNLLHNFAVALKQDPELSGFIIYGSSESYSLKKATSLINRSVKYLTQDLSSELRVDKNRIEIVYEGKKDAARITLQPINKKSLPAGLKLPKTN